VVVTCYRQSKKARSPMSRLWSFSVYTQIVPDPIWIYSQ